MGIAYGMTGFDSAQLTRQRSLSGVEGKINLVEANNYLPLQQVLCRIHKPQPKRLSRFSLKHLSFIHFNSVVVG
jgi:hypothetical protein